MLDIPEAEEFVSESRTRPFVRRWGEETTSSESPSIESMSSDSLGTNSVTINTGFLAELIKTDRLRDWRLPGVRIGDIKKELLLLLMSGDLNKVIMVTVIDQLVSPNFITLTRNSFRQVAFYVRQRSLHEY